MPKKVRKKVKKAAVKKKAVKKKSVKRVRKKARRSSSSKNPKLAAIFFIGVLLGMGLLWGTFNKNEIFRETQAFLSSVQKGFQDVFYVKNVSLSALSGETKAKPKVSAPKVIKKKTTPVTQKKTSVAKKATTTKVVSKPKVVKKTTPPKQLKTEVITVKKKTPVVTTTSKPSVVVSRSATTPKIIFVIDDVGYHLRYENLLFSTGLPLTIAILPQLDHSRHFSREGKRKGYEIILHQPLQPQSNRVNPGPGLITTSMGKKEVLQILDKNLKTVPDAVGINNHMGSRATQDVSVMKWIMRELKSRRMFFLDSMTSANSVGWRMARQQNLPYVKRSVFIDNEDDYQYIENQIWKLVDEAKKNGVAIGIGHYKQKTLETIRRMGPKIKRQGIKVVRLREVLIK